VALDYDAIEVLAAVVRTGSFESAARELNVTQSAVSQRVRVLEDRLGTVLVVRGRPCVPTEEGRLLCQHFDQVLLMQHELRVQLETDRASPITPRRVRIGVNNDSVATWFPEVVRLAHAQLNLRIEILNNDQDHTEESLRNGEAMAVVTTNELPVPGCRRLSLGAMEYMAVATPGFVKREIGPEITLARLAGAPSLVFDRKDTLNEQWMMLTFGAAATPSCHMIPSFEGLIACCLGGVGWSLLPRAGAQPHVAAGRLVEFLPGTRIAVSLHWQARSQQSQTLLRLTEIVREVAQMHLAPDRFRNPQIGQAVAGS
jgi:LysR family transcriptional regulator (chromosome initiation inhibitor)